MDKQAHGYTAKGSAVTWQYTPPCSYFLAAMDMPHIHKELTMDSNRYTRETVPAIPTALRETTTTLGQLQQTLAALLEKHLDLKYQNYQLRQRCQALEQSSKQHDELYDHAPIGYAIFTREGGIHNINTAGAQMLQQQRSHLIGKPFSSFITHADKDVFLRHVAQCKQQLRHAITVHVQQEKSTVALHIVSVAVQEAPSLAPYVCSVLLDSPQQQPIQCDMTLQLRPTIPPPDFTSNHCLSINGDTLPETVLEQELEQKEKDLTVLALQCLEKQEQFAMLEQQLKKALRVSPSQSRHLIQTMLHDVRESLEQHSPWQRVEQHVGKGARHFLNTLARNYPHLTAAELKICSLIRLAMSTKEIASVLHTSPKTIENQRYRIRKKLGLSVKQQLVSFLMAL